MDEGERGDDEDHAGRCRSDARGQPSTAFVAVERVGGAVARAGVDITREREKKFRERPLLYYLPETEGAGYVTQRRTNAELSLATPAPRTQHPRRA